VTVLQKRYLLLAIIVQMRHNQRDILRDYWLTQEEFHMAFKGKTMKTGTCFHAFRSLHFSDNKNEPDKTEKATTNCGK